MTGRLSETGFALRFALREMRGGLRGFRIFLACLALGVFAIAAVGSLSGSIVAGLQQNARIIMGGDIEISQSARDLTAAEKAWVGSRGDASRTQEMRAMARVPREAGERVLVELKAVDSAYPLYGVITLDPPMAIDAALGLRNGIYGAVAEPVLLTRLNAQVGDRLRIGDTEVELRAVTVTEPDKVANAFTLGPRLMLGEAGFETTGLGAEGSLIRFRYRVKTDPAVDYQSWAQAMRSEFPDATFRIRNARDAQPSIQNFIDRLAVFLTLAGVTALLIGGIGVGNAVQAYLGGKRAVIATLKSLGARGGLIFQIYLLQIGLLALVGISIGLVAGAIAPFFAIGLFAADLPIPARAQVQFPPLVLATAYGLLTALVFAVWPLARARDIPAASLFRDIVAPSGRWPRPFYVVVTIIAAFALAALAVFSGGQAFIAQWFVLGAAGALILFRLAATAIIALVRRIPRMRGATLRLALSNIARPDAPTAGVVVSLGAGLTVLVATALVQGNIQRQVAERIPDVAPAFFFLDIQPDQVASFESTMKAAPGFISLERVPNLRGRLSAINGVSAAQVTVDPEVQWVKRSEFGATYSAAKPPRAQIVEGSWWPEDYQGPPIISLDEQIARGLHLKIGDTLTFNILGRDIEARIYNLRRIDWQDFGINFFTIFGPGTLEGAPQTHLATASVRPESEAAVYRMITDRFDNVSTVRVREVIETATQLLGRIAGAAQGTAAFTILAGLLVLAGAVAAGHRRRVYDAVILKVLGATRGTVLRAYVLEFAILGLITAAIAGGGGTLGAWLVITQVMKAPWTFLPAIALGTAAGGVMLTVLLGLAGTWLALSQRPAPVLRHA